MGAAAVQPGPPLAPHDARRPCGLCTAAAGRASGQRPGRGTDLGVLPRARRAGRPRIAGAAPARRTAGLLAIRGRACSARGPRQASDAQRPSARRAGRSRGRGRAGAPPPSETPAPTSGLCMTFMVSSTLAHSDRTVSVAHCFLGWSVYCCRRMLSRLHVLATSPLPAASSRLSSDACWASGSACIASSAPSGDAPGQPGRLAL
jgi:hypothetical protein